MIKVISALLLTVVLSVSATAQKKAEWKEMHDFHTVMGGTFHPAEEGNMEPIKTRSQEMVDKAVAWEKSTPPEGYNKKAVAGTLKKLVEGSKELHQMVKSKATDKELLDKLSSLHDVFHEIMEKCTDKEQHKN
jgi:hypothetical protein